MVPNKVDSYQTVAPKQLPRLGYMRFLTPKPQPSVARTIEMASIDRQGGIVGGGGGVRNAEKISLDFCKYVQNAFSDTAH